MPMMESSNISSKREIKAPMVREFLDQRGENLHKILKESIADFPGAEISVSIDMVTVQIDSVHLAEVCELLKYTEKFGFDYLSCITVVDYEEEQERFEMVYHLISIRRRHKMAIKVSLPSNDPTVPSVLSIWKSADWFEREAHDLFGIKFKGRENLLPLLLFEEFEGYPGRKSYPFHDYGEW
ncbi:MAG TPA: NADH-quinone oxidoreductase subunit C [Dehalococcoidia bacterium]|jgi:NADH-quinone oxidoreductase subunit C|nr:NADH-quinone oxidoreductase subunit C [Dehalococcoidia bacterium]